MRYNVQCSVQQFQEIVNVVFHDMEAEVYDEIHQDMWLSLPRQFELLTSDALPFASGNELRMLDIGSGTGLSTKLFLRTELGRRVRHLHLLDTSARMFDQLDKAPIAIHTSRTLGVLDDVPFDGMFDIIVACSVLHHIPDLKSFAMQVRRLQRDGGLFIHLQDPNADFQPDSERWNRREIYERYRRSRINRNLKRSMVRVKERLSRYLRGHSKRSYLHRVNDELMRRGIVSKPMDPTDIWRVTDIHIGSGTGVSVNTLSDHLVGYQMISRRTYGFFSELASSLPKHLLKIERALTDSRSQDGFYFGAAWKLSN